MKELFHKSDKGMGDEDWFFFVLDVEENTKSIVHEWSHSVGGPSNFVSGSRSYSIDDFQREKPNQHRHFVDWQAAELKGKD